MSEKLRQAAQQALEALQLCRTFILRAIERATERQLPSDTIRDLNDELAYHDKAITALHAALAEQPAEQEPVAWLPSAEWTACVKLPVTVHVRQQRPGETHVSTREGITPVKPDDLIMRGVSGEEYPIGREIFERTYRLGEAPPPAKPAEQEPVAWRFTGIAGLKRYMTQKQYDAQTPQIKKWYEPFKCASCAQPAKREPLTDEEILKLAYPLWHEELTKREADTAVYSARAIERAHGIGEPK